MLVRPGRERLVGTVEVDETYIGGRDPGVGRGKGRGDKVLTGIAVEIKEPRGYGRCRLAPLPDASAASLCAFVADHVEPGATVITDGRKGYLGLDRRGYTHEARSQRAARLRGDGQAAELLAAVHRVASLAKRWILGTHQGAIDQAHLHQQKMGSDPIFLIFTFSPALPGFGILGFAVAPRQCGALGSGPNPTFS